LTPLSRRDKGAGQLISFAQFAYIATEGFVQSAHARTKSEGRSVYQFHC